MKKSIFAIAMVSLLSIGSLTAFAGTQNVEGGTWTYGNCWSKYYHSSEIHGSSCINGNGDMDTDYNIDPKSQSSASVASTWSGNTAYYCVGTR